MAYQDVQSVDCVVSSIPQWVDNLESRAGERKVKVEREMRYYVQIFYLLYRIVDPFPHKNLTPLPRKFLPPPLYLSIDEVEEFYSELDSRETVSLFSCTPTADYEPSSSLRGQPM